MARTRLYRNGNLEQENFPVQDISSYVCQPDLTVWLDLCAPTAADLEMIREEFSLHELAIEDARNEHQRPKLDRYRDHLFMSAYAVCTTDTGVLEAIELSVFITPTP
nr:CorA family divalent cation transporter [Streptacidiphilus sp. PB12-B1b]